MEAFRQRLQVRQQAENLLGADAWYLLVCYGKFMDGPYAGSYVGGIPVDDQRALVDQLARGETVPVHLMHRHRSGCAKSSSLRWSGSTLVMVFDDREVEAR